MKAAPARLIQQGQQRGFEVLHLLLRLGAGLGCIRVEQGTETGDLIRKPVVLSRKDRNLLLGNSGSRLGLIPLMLPKMRPVTPETDGSGFRFVTHSVRPDDRWCPHVFVAGERHVKIKHLADMSLCHQGDMAALRL